MAEVRLEHVWKVFDEDVVAVRDVSFTVPDGAFVVIVGPSGCGKTTTLRMIAGLESISEGEIFIDGDRVNDVHPKRRDIAMVFQNYALYPHMTVRQNLEFALKMRKVPSEDRRRRVDRAAEMLELDQLLDRKPKALSGGQRQRVALGRAIVREPKAFLFDEPLSNLDAKLRTQTRAELQRLHRELHGTSIYVTHDQVEAMTMADLIVVMNQGEVQQVAPPMELYDEPHNRFVAGFIGAVGMNFFNGRVEERDGAWHFVPEAGPEIPLGSRPPRLQGRGTLGVRPEALSRAAPEDLLSFPAVAEVVETLGSQTLVHFPAGYELKIAALSPADAPRVEEEFRLRAEPERLHFFNEDGSRVE